MLSPARLQLLARRVARRYTIAGMDQDDLTQEAVLAMLRSGEVAESHLIMSARRRLGHLARRAKLRHAQHPTVPLSHPPPDHRPGPEQLAIANDLLDTLLRSLTTRQAQVVDLRFRHGFSDDDIAGTLGISLKTVRNTLALARDSLERLGNLDGDGGHL